MELSYVDPSAQIKSRARVRDLGEVFTAEREVNAILDLVSEEAASITSTFLEPGCGHGNFLVAILKRKLETVADKYAGHGEFTNQTLLAVASIYGVDICEENVAQARTRMFEMAVDHYCTHRNSPKRCDGFDAAVGAVLTANIVVGDFLNPGGLSFMQFDVIIGNPPYQLDDGGHGASAKPIYHHFIRRAKEMNPKHISMIVPARWYAGGKGLGKFRAEMIADRHISHIVDFPRGVDVFPDNEIKGGVMYFLWDASHDGDCTWVTSRKGEQSEPRSMDLRSAKDVILRDELSLSILAKVQEVHGDGKWMDSEVQARKPFGLATNMKGHKKKASGDVVLYQNGGTAFYPKDKITKNVAWVGKHKVLLSNVSGDGMKTLPNLVSGKPFVGEKGSTCTETYLVAGLFDTKEAADRRVTFVKTKFFRLMLSLRKISIGNARGTFAFVPVMDNGVVWTDADLYRHFGLTQDEIDHIEATVKAMP